MFTRIRLLLVAVVAPLALIAATTTPASAATVTAGVAAVQGVGGILPGLTATPAAQNFYVNGTATVVGEIQSHAEVGVVHTIAAAGTDLAGSYAEGAGTIAVDVSGLPPMSGVFVRVGVVVVVAVTGPLGTVGTGACDFVPTAVPVPQVKPMPPTVTFPAVTSFNVGCAALAVA